MLGEAIGDYCRHSGIEYTLLSHAQLDVTDPAAIAATLIRYGARDGDVLINCAGLREESKPTAIDMVRVNALAPHVLADVTRHLGMRMWHISTDCVYGGRRELEYLTVGHSIHDLPSPTSLYGRTKLAGEVSAEHVAIVRTSFVGPTHGLWRWVAQQDEGAVVEGWSRAYWSGSTVWEVARSLFDLPYRARGVYHLATPAPITKLLALRLIALYLERDDLRIVSAPTVVDRALAPTIAIASLADALQTHAYLLERAG